MAFHVHRHYLTFARGLSAFALALLFLSSSLPLTADTLWTTEGKRFEGKLAAFKYELIYFNIYKFGKYHSEKRFPIAEVWKIEFNPPEERRLSGSSETERYYQRFRKGKRTRTVRVSATSAWVDTGIDLKANQEILFEAAGEISISPGMVVFQNGTGKVDLNPRNPIPTQPSGALIGKIAPPKRGPALFYIGSDKAPMRNPQGGRLWLGINDGSTHDNSGAFSVTIYY